MELSAGVLDQAVAWSVRLQSGTAGEAERQACVAWRGDSPLHEQAWRQVQAVEQAFNTVAADNARIAHRALDAAAAASGKPVARRRALTLLGLGGIAALLAVHAEPWRQTTVHASAAGERRQLVLADGTRLQLNSRTTVDVVFTPWQRLLVLREGEIFIDTGADAHAWGGKRPFEVQAGGVRLQPIGTAFAVRQDPLPATQLHVREGAVAIHLQGRAPVLAQAGETWRAGAGTATITRVLQPEADPTGWLDGVLVARQMRLDAFAAALSRQLGQPVHCDADAAALRVSGVFQLDGPNAVQRALDALAAALPVRIAATDKGLAIALRRGS